jgi:hypothetical protein
MLFLLNYYMIENKYNAQIFSDLIPKCLRKI